MGYQISTRNKDDKYLDPDNWLATKSTAMESPPSIGTIHKGYKPVSDAPGTYVMAE